MWWKCIFVGCGIYLFGELVGAKTMLILGCLGFILYLFLVCATIKFYCEEYAPHNEAILVPLLRKLGFRYRGRVRKGKYIRGMRMVRNNDTLEICTVMEKEGQEKLRVYIKDYTIELPYPPSEEHYRLLDTLIEEEFGIQKDRALAIIPPANTSLVKVEKPCCTSLSVIYPSAVPI